MLRILVCSISVFLFCSTLFNVVSNVVSNWSKCCLLLFQIGPNVVYCCFKLVQMLFIVASNWSNSCLIVVWPSAKCNGEGPVNRHIKGVIVKKPPPGTSSVVALILACLKN